MHLGGRNDDDSVCSVDPEFLAIETGEHYGDSLELKWVDDDPIEGTV